MCSLAVREIILSFFWTSARLKSIVHPSKISSGEDVYKRQVQAGQTLSFGQCVFFFFCCLGEFICIFLALYNAKRIFGCIGKGNSPFTAKTAIQIRKIAMYVLIFAVFSVLSVFKMAFSSFFMCGLFALILFCISLIFDYGCELQQEVDEMI